MTEALFLGWSILVCLVGYLAGNADARYGSKRNVHRLR
jgi:hypothetical protein